MTKGDKVLGIIFPNMHDNAIGELTKLRTMASVPFGGRYRLIDFTLSEMVAAGIGDIGESEVDKSETTCPLWTILAPAVFMTWQEKSAV